MMAGQNTPIVVFDSGVGGLGVFAEIRRLLPHNEIIYCLDNAFFPYGTKADAQIIDRVTSLLPQVVKAYNASLLVIACNTASTLALDAIRERLSIPVVGVVPAIKVAATQSRSRVIGLLATEATIRRAYTDRLINDFAQDCQIIRVGSRRLVEIAEAKVRGDSFDLAEIDSELSPFFENADLDCVVLACTHFDHLQDELTQLAPRPISWICSAPAVALRTQTLVEQLGLHKPSSLAPLLLSTQPIDSTLQNALTQRYGFKRWETLSTMRG